MPAAPLTLPATSTSHNPLPSLWALADFSDCTSKFTIRVSFLPESDVCSSSEMSPFLTDVNFLTVFTESLQTLLPVFVLSCGPQ